MKRHITKNNQKTVVGIIGNAGDLGHQISKLVHEHKYTIIALDKKVSGTMSVQSVMEDSDIVHFCIPPAGFTESFNIRKGQLVILHDSVMATSELINAKHFGGQANVVHMLMNDSKSVIVERNSKDKNALIKHMDALGLKPIDMSDIEHDHLMARSQAPLAILVRLLLTDLKQWHKMGILTASGDALLKALQDRAAKWTDETMKSLLRNPELQILIEDMKKLIGENNNGE